MVSEPAVWHLWAHRYDSGLLMHIGSRRYVEAHLLKDPIIPVYVVEVPAASARGTHWGWLRAGDDTPSMIWPSWPQFEVCFPYGSRAEEKAGRGRILRLWVVPAGVPMHPDDAAALAGDQAALMGDVGRAVRRLLSESPPGWAGNNDGTGDHED